LKTSIAARILTPTGDLTEFQTHDLTEEAFKETHRILTDGIGADNKEKDKSADYGGIYRATSVGWTFTAFADPDDIPKRKS
jgi:Fic family protein